MPPQVRFDCIRKTNFYEVVVTSASFLFFLELTAIVAEVVLNSDIPWCKRFENKRRWSLVQAVCLVVAYFMYSPVTAMLFQVFNCKGER